MSPHTILIEALTNTSASTSARIADGHTVYTTDIAASTTAKQLNPVEEARAVQAMLDECYTRDDASQALGWSRQLVTARAKILKLSEVGQQLVGSVEIPVSAIDNRLAIGDVSPRLAEAVAAANRGLQRGMSVGDRQPYGM